MGNTDNHKPHELERRGLLFVLSSPSGAGKSTLSRMLLEAERRFAGNETEEVTGADVTVTRA